MKSKKRILIIGAGGYVGSVLVPYLISKNFEVIAFDIFWFGKNTLQNDPNLTIICGDMVNYDFSKILNDIDVVIHLACISNDPSFDLNPELSQRINFESTKNILKHINNSSIKRFIYASSSSVYGVKKEPLVTEELPSAPITLYAKYKYESEKYFINFKKDHFDLVILRPATLCGPSPRLRLDLIANILASNAFYKKTIQIHGGKQYRPQLNIKEMINAYELCIQYPGFFQNEVFNFGEENYTVDEIAEIVEANCPHSISINRVPISDNRSYRISSQKFYHFFQYQPKLTLKNALEDLNHFFAQNPNLNIDDIYFHNVKRMKQVEYVL